MSINQSAPLKKKKLNNEETKASNLNMKLDNGVHPWWTTSLDPSLTWVGPFVNSTK